MKILPKFLNKKISAPVGIGIVVLLGLIAGGVLFWQYLPEEKEEAIYSNTFRIKEKELKECYKDPRQALDKFLSYLHNGRYEKAVGLYGGSYKALVRVNPEVNPQNHPKLLQRWCEVNGGNCLEHGVLSEGPSSENRAKFSVRFFWGDGSVFKIAPPAGQEGEPVPGDTLFEVTKAKNCWKVMTLPPYTP